MLKYCPLFSGWAVCWHSMKVLSLNSSLRSSCCLHVLRFQMWVFSNFLPQSNNTTVCLIGFSKWTFEWMSNLQYVCLCVALTAWDRVNHLTPNDHLRALQPLHNPAYREAGIDNWWMFTEWLWKLSAPFLWECFQFFRYFIIFIDGPLVSLNGSCCTTSSWLGHRDI